MGDADVLAKLSRILETHSASDPEDDGTTLDDLLHNISVEAGVTFDDDGMERTGERDRRIQDPDFYERPTPFEVWENRQKEKFEYKYQVKKDNKRLTEKEWDGLVEHLHRTNKMKESALMKEQNQGLALELNGLSFKPEMNATSLQLASTMKSLEHRLPGMISKREAALERRRAEMMEREMENCTFTPSREGAKTSEKYLRRMGKTTSTPQDFFNYHKEKLRRNDQRKQIVDEINSRELTFTPQLNAKSKKLQERMKQSRVIQVDPVSRQTVSVRRKFVDFSSEADERSMRTPSGNDSHIPEISSRAKSYRGRGIESAPVYDRLYGKAVKQQNESHNRQVDVMQNKLNLSLKPWENTPRAPNTSYSWTQSKTHLAKSRKGSVDHLIDNVDKPVAVVEFNDSLGDLWKHMRMALPLDDFLQRDMDNEVDMRGHAAEL